MSAALTLNGQRRHYSDEWIEITDTYVRIYGVFYAVSHINSVRTILQPAPRLSWGIIGFLIGFLGGYAVSSLFTRSSATSTVVGAVAGIMLGIILALVQKDNFLLQLRMSSGEAPQLRSRDSDYVRRLQVSIVRMMSVKSTR